jgi:hypothetical protein
VAGVFARSDLQLDYEPTPFAFLESTWFLATVFAATIVWYLLERRDPGGPHERALPAVAALLGALLFAGTLAAAGGPAWAGAIAGAACALLGARAVTGLVGRARARLEGAASALLGVWVDLAAVALAALAVLAWPVGLVALAPLVWLAVVSARASDRKHAGLRTLR